MLGDKGNIKTKISSLLQRLTVGGTPHRNIIQHGVCHNGAIGQDVIEAHKRTYGFCLGALGSREVVALELVPEVTWQAAMQERM